MLYKIIIKNFRSNLKNYILFFASNIIAVAELFTFSGINDVIFRAVRNEEMASSLKIDFMVASALVGIIACALMLFSMKSYLKIRVRDYSTFIVIGMRTKMAYRMLFLEYGIGCVMSLLFGFLFGNISLYVLRLILYNLNPEWIQISAVSTSVYYETLKISVIIMALVFFILLVWMDGRDLSGLMMKSEVQEKKPKNKKWGLFVVLGIGIVAFAFYMFQGEDMVWINSHGVWIVGSCFILAFGVGLVIEWIKKRRRFYLKNIFAINQLYYKYQSSMLTVFMLFVIYFFAFSYLNIQLSSEPPIVQSRADYPYEMIWMAQDKDKEFSEQFAERYEGSVKRIPMIRVFTRYSHKYIGVSESEYEKLSGEKLNLHSGEVAVGVEVRNFEKKESVTDSIDDREWLNLGLIKEGQEPIGAQALKPDDENKREIKEMFTQNLIGSYGSLYMWEENMAVFPDDYFNENWERISSDSKESSWLTLFRIPKKYEDQAWKELKTYVETSGLQEIQRETMQALDSGDPVNVVYGTKEYLQGIEMEKLFSVISKGFILVSMFLSGAFITGVKMLSDMDSYKRQYEFLQTMGMRKKNRVRNLRKEVMNISNMALGTGIVMAVIYAIGYYIRCGNRGEILENNFWAYWGTEILLFTGFMYLIQRAFAYYAVRHVENGE